MKGVSLLRPPQIFKSLSRPQFLIGEFTLSWQAALLDI
jgi:hypothetical protein